MTDSKLYSSLQVYATPAGPAAAAYPAAYPIAGAIPIQPAYVGGYNQGPPSIIYQPQAFTAA